VVSTSKEYCDPCAQCDPCCAPKPKKYIECECYTPAFYDLQCDWKAFLSGEFLYWYASESNLPHTGVFTPIEDFFDSTNTEARPISIYFLDVKWKTGFRVGLGFNLCDG